MRKKKNDKIDDEAGTASPRYSHFSLSTSHFLLPRLRFPEFRDEPGWNCSTIGEVATILKGKGLSKADIDPQGKRPCIRYAELYTRYGEVIDAVHSRTSAPDDDLFLSDANDVIIPSSGETKADIATACCVLRAGVALGSDLNVLRTQNDGVFLSYYVNGRLRPEIAKVAQGDTVVHLYPSQLKKTLLAVPSPAEQRKIADCLGSLDQWIGGEAAKLEALRLHKKGLMQQLFPRPGESRPRLRFPEFKNAGEWEETTLSQLVDIQSGATPSKANPAFWNGTIPWVSAKDMKRLFLEDSEDHITSAAVANGARLVPPGTLLMLTRGMTLLKDVPICVLRREMCFNQDVKALRPKVDVDGLFLAFLLLGNKQRLLTMVDIAGHGTGKLDTNELQSFELASPERAEQRRIAACLSSLDDVLAAQSRKLEGLKAHKKGLMQQLFPSPEVIGT